MAESILVTGKKISSMELVTNVIGNEKIPTGQPDDLAVTPNQIADHTITRGDLASQEDLSQVEVSLGTQIADLENDVTSADNSIRGLIAAEEAARISGDNVLQVAIDAESLARTDADTELQSNLDDEVAARIAADALKVDKEGSVTSVAGRVGDVTLEPSDVLVEGFGNQDTVNRYVAKPFWSGLAYDSGERVVLANGDIVKSTIDGNTNDPNTDMTGWVNNLVEIQANIDRLNRISANSYGASPSATWQVNRAAIQAANDAAKALGGAVVTLTSGTYEVKGVIQDSKVIYDLNGVTLKSPDGLAPDIIRTRTTNCECDMTKDSNVVIITSGDASGIEVGTRVGVLGGGGILDSQVSKLASAITETSTTITLVDARGLTTLAPLLIGDELISFTGVSGNTITGVTRGVFGTTAVSHTTSEDIGVARYLIATVIAKDGNTITLNKPCLKTASGVRLVYGTIGAGVIGFPTLDGNKPIGGAPSSVYCYVAPTASSGIYDLKVINGDVGGVMFSNGSAYNYGNRVFMHDCGVPEGGRGGSFWLYQGCEHNHFNHIEVTGKVWVGVYLDDRTSSSDPWNSPNDNNTFVTTNIDITESTTAPLNIVSGRYNKFLNGKIKAPRVGINISDNSQGVGGGAKSVGNIFDKFDIDVSEYPYLVYSTGNTLSNINIKRGRLAPLVAAGNCLYAISPALGAPPIIPKGYRKNSFTHTKLTDWTGFTIENGEIVTTTTTTEVEGEPVTETVVQSGVIDISSTASRYNPIIYNTVPVPANAGETWAAALDVSVPTGYPDVTLRLAVIAYERQSTGTQLLKETKFSVIYTVSSGTTVRMNTFTPVTPEGTTGLRFQIQMMDVSASEGRRIVVHPLITLEKDTITVQSLFDGDTEGAMWTGDVGASPSLLF